MPLQEAAFNEPIVLFVLSKPAGKHCIIRTELNPSAGWRNFRFDGTKLMELHRSMCVDSGSGRLLTAVTRMNVIYEMCKKLEAKWQSKLSASLQFCQTE